MLEQTGNALVFYAFFVESKVGKTGLTVTVDIWRNQTEVVTGGSATEQGDGIYYYSLASGSVTVEGLYVAVFKTATSTVDQQHIPALWVAGKAGVENLDAAVTSRSSHSAADVWAAATRTLTSLSALAAQIASAVLDAVAASYNTSGTIGAKITTAAGAAGDGSSTYTVTVTDANGATLDGVQCWATTDAAGANTVASGVTNSHGKVTFALDAGSYYLWRQRAGTNFSNPQGFTVV